MLFAFSFSNPFLKPVLEICDVYRPGAGYANATDTLINLLTHPNLEVGPTGSRSTRVKDQHVMIVALNEQ